MLFVIVDVIWLSFKPVLAHASCVSSTLLASVKSVCVCILCVFVLHCIVVV